MSAQRRAKRARRVEARTVAILGERGVYVRVHEAQSAVLRPFFMIEFRKATDGWEPHKDLPRAAATARAVLEQSYGVNLDGVQIGAAYDASTQQLRVRAFPSREAMTAARKQADKEV